MLRSTDSEQKREERERKRERPVILSVNPLVPRRKGERENEDMEAGGNKIYVIVCPRKKIKGFLQEHKRDKLATDNMHRRIRSFFCSFFACYV